MHTKVGQFSASARIPRLRPSSTSELYRTAILMSRRLFKLVYLLQRWSSKLKIARATIVSNNPEQALPKQAEDSGSTQEATQKVYFCQECNDIRLNGKWVKELSHTVEIRRHYSKTDTLPDLPGLRGQPAVVAPSVLCCCRPLTSLNGWRLLRYVIGRNVDPRYPRPHQHIHVYPGTPIFPRHHLKGD